MPNQIEAALVEGLTVYGYKTLRDLVLHLGGSIDGVTDIVQLLPQPHTEIMYTRPDSYLNFKDIRGQETAKRALEIAAAGGHNIMMHGPPGTGKTMLARAFPYLLPDLSFDEMLEVTAIHSSSMWQPLATTRSPTIRTIWTSFPSRSVLLTVSMIL